MTTQQNYNVAYATNFKLEFIRAQHLNFFVQTAQLPGVTSQGAEIPVKRGRAFMQDDRLDYDPISVTFLVDESFENYLYIYNWMTNNAYRERPPEFQQDATLHILTGNKTPNIIVKLFGMFPQMLGAIDLMSSTTDPNPLMCNVMFRYQKFEIERVNNPI